MPSLLIDGRPTDLLTHLQRRSSDIHVLLFQGLVEETSRAAEAQPAALGATAEHRGIFSPAAQRKEAACGMAFMETAVAGGHVAAAQWVMTQYVERSRGSQENAANTIVNYIRFAQGALDRNYTLMALAAASGVPGMCLWLQTSGLCRDLRFSAVLSNDPPLVIAASQGNLGVCNALWNMCCCPCCFEGSDDAAAPPTPPSVSEHAFLTARNRERESALVRATCVPCACVHHPSQPNQPTNQPPHRTRRSRTGTSRCASGSWGRGCRWRRSPKPESRRRR